MNPDINTMPLPSADLSPNAGPGPQLAPPVVKNAPDNATGILPTHSQAVLPDKPTTSATETEVDFAKRWVTTAKAIIAQTKYDPYLQSSELSKAGAEYRKELRLRS